MKFLFIGLILFSTAAWSGPHPDALPRWQPGPTGDLSFQTSSFLQSVAYHKPDKIATESNAAGAYSKVNQTWDQTGKGKWYIEEQRYAFDAVVAGLSYQRQDLIERAQKIFDWGLRQEKPDGSFDCPDNFHSAAFFIEAAAHAALLIEASSMKSANHSWVEGIKPKLLAAARWMTDPRNEVSGRKHDAPYTHRNYLDAAAIGETGVLVGDRALIDDSKIYIEDGIRKQDASGFNPEKGGSDTSYHSVGLLFAIDYYTLVADDSQRKELSPMIQKGIAWLQSRTRADGTIDQHGNTRTGFGQEVGRNGTKKFMSYGSAYRSAYVWAMITDNPSLAAYAQKLHDGQEIEKKNRK